MNKTHTELIFILDKSGSMAGLEKDTIGGFNSMLEKQKAVQGEAVITTVLFDNSYNLLHDRIDIRAVGPITEKEYQAGDSTALIDALGRTIHKIASMQKNTAPAFRAQKVLFVIITDGEENASREYSAEKVKAQIELYKKEQGWEFIFLGANIDAVETAAKFGIAPDRAQSFHSDEEGTALNYSVVSKAVARFRTCAMPAAWNQEIEADFKKRRQNQ